MAVHVRHVRRELRVERVGHLQRLLGWPDAEPEGAVSGDEKLGCLVAADGHTHARPAALAEQRKRGAIMNTADYQALKTEITTDPKTLGYAGKSDYDVSVLMNTPGASGETLFKSYTPTEDLVACIVRAEVDGVAAAGRT